MMELASKKLFKLGLIINPFAGIGGALALKGSDGPEIRAKALALGAEQKALYKSALALAELLPLQSQIEFYTAAGDMGEHLARNMGFAHRVVYQPSHAQTEGSDTVLAANALLEQGIELIMFAGGDGTARNICEAVNQLVPVLGIPAGCKIHSGVYAITPQAAGRVASMLIKGEILSLNQADVMDIDEALFRQGRVNARQYGEMRVPSELRYIQAVKMGGRESDELVLSDIAAHIIEDMAEHPEHHYIMGSGSTVDFVMQELALSNTLLGVDVVFQGKLLAQDVSADELLNLIKDKKSKLVLTPIGGQGHIFGRGNQQLSPHVLKTIEPKNVLIVASKSKLQGLNKRPLIADTGDIELDRRLAGAVPVITGYHDQVLYPIGSFD